MYPPRLTQKNRVKMIGKNLPLESKLILKKMKNLAGLFIKWPSVSAESVEALILERMRRLTSDNKY